MKSTSLGRIILGHLHPKALDADRVDPIPVRVQPNPQDKAFVGRNLFEGSEGMCWKATTDLMVKMKEEIARTEAEFLVALLPASEQAIVDRLREHVKNVGLGETLTEAELNAPEKQVARRLAESGVAAVVMGPRMRQLSEKPWLLYFLRDAHLNEAGHKMVARILHEELSSRGWLTASTPYRP